MKRKPFFGIIFSAILLCSGLANAYDGPAVNINFEEAEQTANWAYRYDLYDVQAGEQIQMNVDLFTGDIMSGFEWYEDYTPGGEVLGYENPVIMPGSGWVDMAPVTENQDRTPFWIQFQEAGDYVVVFDLSDGRLDARIPGDVNGDGETTIVDALLAAQYAEGIVGLNLLDQVIADFDGDGQVTCNDAPGIDSDCEEIAALYVATGL